MNPSDALLPAHPATKRRWLWILLALLLVPVLGLGLLAAGLASLFHSSSDARALRVEWARTCGIEGRKQVGVRLGSVTLAAARAGLSCSRLDPEARAALQAVRGIELSVSEVTSGTKRPDVVALLAAADKVLSARGWERVVGVLDGHQMVGVYWSAESASASRMRGLVVVFDGQHLVLACVKADLRPLQECLENQGSRHDTDSGISLSLCEPWQTPMRRSLAAWL